MTMNRDYAEREPSRDEIDALPGATLVEFGTPWCGHCSRTQPMLEKALADRPALRHLKIEDGPGRRLGRSFGVKLWPTLIFLNDGREVARLVRPHRTEAIVQALERQREAG